MLLLSLLFQMGGHDFGVLCVHFHLCPHFCWPPQEIQVDANLVSFGTYNLICLLGMGESVFSHMMKCSRASGWHSADYLSA